MSRTLIASSYSDTNTTTTVPALTTIWTSPQSCTIANSAIEFIESSFTGLLSSNEQPPSFLSCVPPDYLNALNFGVYSPGICPEGYSAGCAWPDGENTAGLCCSRCETLLQN